MLCYHANQFEQNKYLRLIIKAINCVGQIIILIVCEHTLSEGNGVFAEEMPSSMPQPIPGVHMVWWRIKRRAELRKIAREQQYREFPFQKPFCSPLHAIPQHLNVWEHNSLQPEKPATFCCTGNHWFPCKMTSEEKMHKFHIDDLSLPRFRQCF